MAFTYFWHDYETFGRLPRRDRPAQFAGVRTDADLQEIAPPVELYCQPADDFVPDPEACLLTGITPARCAAQGLPEHRFAAAIEAELGQPGTLGTGYNSLRFDDEVTRHLLWRTLRDPYGREWRNGCGRWDLLDLARTAWVLRPDGIQWPRHEDGRPSFKLEHLSAANGLAHASAHDALSDVRATLALARLIRQRQPRLYDFALHLHDKRRVVDEIGVGRPFVHVSGRYGTERGCLAVVWPLAPHPVNRNEIIVWDLAQDPAELFGLDAASLRERLFVPADKLPAGVTRLPVKTIHINRSPIVIANLKVVGGPVAERWGLDLARVRRHAETAARHGAGFAGVWAEVMRRPDMGPVDVDEDLYGGLLDDADRGALDRLQALDGPALADRIPAFFDPRLDELLLRYRARNFEPSLTAAERTRWHAHCAARLTDPSGTWRSLAATRTHIAALRAEARGPEAGRVLDEVDAHLTHLARTAGLE